MFDWGRLNFSRPRDWISSQLSRLKVGSVPEYLGVRSAGWSQISGTGHWYNHTLGVATVYSQRHCSKRTREIKYFIFFLNLYILIGGESQLSFSFQIRYDIWLALWFPQFSFNYLNFFWNWEMAYLLQPYPKKNRSKVLRPSWVTFQFPKFH